MVSLRKILEVHELLIVLYSKAPIVLQISKYKNVIQILIL